MLAVDMVGNGTGQAVSTTAIWTWASRNPETGTGFYTTQHDTSRSKDSTTFSISLNPSAGVVVVPNVNLDGRQSKILVTDYSFGRSTLLYCSTDILTYGICDVDVLVLYLKTGQIGQCALKNTDAGATHSVIGTAEVAVTSANSTTTTFTYTQTAGKTAQLQWCTDIS